MLCVLELFVRYVRILRLGLAGTTSGKGSQVTTLGYSYNWTCLLTQASSLPRLAPSRRETFGVVSNRYIGWRVAPPASCSVVAMTVSEGCLKKSVLRDLLLDPYLRTRSPCEVPTLS